MTIELPPGPFPGIRVPHGERECESLRQACRAGLVRRVRHGAYVDTVVWEAADPRARSLLVIQAVAASRGFRDVVSHESAAVLLGLPLLIEPTVVHFTESAARSTRSRSGVVWHSAHLDGGDVVEAAPFLVTSAARTAADIAIGASFAAGVAVLDGVLRLARATTDDVLTAIDSSTREVGRAKAVAALAFADPRAANPGESLSRVVIDELGFVSPTSLQEPFTDDAGLIGFTDMWWEEVGGVGEFDGFQKYANPEFRGGRSPARVAVDERSRERRLEALPRVERVGRWVWADVQEPPRLHRVLVELGIPLRGGRRTARDTRERAQHQRSVV